MPKRTDRGRLYLNVAALCDRVLDEKDGTVSLIRIIDRLTVRAEGPDPPEQMPPTTATFTLYLLFKSPDRMDVSGVELVGRAPSGEILRQTLPSTVLEGEERGASLRVHFGLTFAQAGLYWFDVVVGRSVAAMLPLRVLYERVQTGPDRPA